MALESGQMIAHYRVAEKIGEGGMGEVYRAADTRLKRDVALKLLPQAFVTDQERMTRFAREAQALASLNHANIGAIYGLEQDGDTHCLVLELIGGQTLAERIKQGPMPLDEALKVARQIAEGLEAAHEGGIIHRDLKPANIKVTEDGAVKILDFGLAKAMVGDSASPDSSMSPTLTTPATHQGVILGTAAYMSPEQAKGNQADRRADIWAYGVILHEMLVGRRLFSSNNISETLAAVLMKEPDMDELPTSTPASIRSLVQRCLKKEPRERLQAIGEARILIDTYQTSPKVPAEKVASPGGGGSTSGVTLPWLVAGALLAALATALWMLWPAAMDDSHGRYHIRAQVPETNPLYLDNTGMPAVLSPDGQSMAYVTTNDSREAIWIQDFHNDSRINLSGTDQARSPFYSPDGKWVGFFTSESMKKVSTSGGAPQILTTVVNSRGGTWSTQGQIVYTPDLTSGLSIISAVGGEPKELTTITPPERSHRWPSFMPDGKHVLFLNQYMDEAYDAGTIEAVNIDTGERTILHRGGTYPRYASTGHLVFGREGTLFAMEMDPETLAVSNLPVPVREEVVMKTAYSTGDGAAFFDISKTGHLAYVRGALSQIEHTMVWVSRNGEEKTILDEPKAFGVHQLSPDQTRIALTIQTDNGANLWVYHLERDVMTRLTFDMNITAFTRPVWSPDNRFLFISSKPPQSGLWKIWRIAADGSGEPEIVHEDERSLDISSASPEGHIAFHVTNPDTAWDVEVLPMVDGVYQAPQEFLRGENYEILPAFSPDGKWIAYVNYQSNLAGIYVRPYPGPGGQWQISGRGSYAPTWTRGGSELVYQDSEQWLSVDIKVENDVLLPSRARPVLENHGYRNTPPGYSYDITADGSQFLALKNSQTVKGPDTDHVDLILNWSTILESVANQAP